MPTAKKFGTFGGVFTPSILTILGVIMYMRMGWVVGNAGLIGTLIIIVIAHVISITTGLSISSIATDKKIGAGGVYYVLSRSLGLPIGGAIGLTLFAGTALSIALYLVGFAESLNAYLGFDTSVDGLRVTGTIALIILAAVALVSTAVALKTQFFILAAIAISLVAIFFGEAENVPSVVPFFGGEGSASLETVFAIFFPAVTGFTAGIAMSGDLRDPKRSIPQGTIAAIAVGFVVYIGLAVFISYNIDAADLVSDNNILMKVAVFAPAVVAGVWGATLSSALGGILGGPRILQAMSVDTITPKFFGRGRGKDNAPWNALILTALIAEVGILIGELDMIARVVSMFYLAAYGFINISFFLESWASADFNPSFRVKRWVGLVGFIATFAVMFKLDMLAMIAAFVVIGGVYAWLQRRQLALGTGDIWQSVWSSVVKTGLRRMAAKEDHMRNWKPNVLLFSGSTDDRTHMLEFSKSLAGRSGVITNFDLIEDPEAKLLFPKHKQAVSDDVLERFGIFGRRIHVQNIFKGIEGIASTFGFSGIEPNTVLMGWPRSTKDPIWFAQMTRRLMELDYNVLYLDYDERRGFGKQEQIDLWWRGIGENAELMLNLARFITSSPGWNNAAIRVFLVNDNNAETNLLRIRMAHLLEALRVDAELHVINNGAEQVPFYDLVKVHSSEADLIFTGIPEMDPDAVSSFAADTTELVSVIGTTLLVKASSQFERAGSEGAENAVVESGEVTELALQPLSLPTDAAVSEAIGMVDQRLEHAASQFERTALAPLSAARRKWVERIGARLLAMHTEVRERAQTRPFEVFGKGLEDLNVLNKKVHHEEDQALAELLGRGITAYMEERDQVMLSAPKVIRTARVHDQRGQRIAWRKVLSSRSAVIGDKGVNLALNELGTAELRLVHRISSDIAKHLRDAAKAISAADARGLQAELARVNAEAEAMVKEHLNIADAMPTQVLHLIRRSDRDLCNGLARAVERRAVRKEHRMFTTGARLKEAERAAQYIEEYAGHWERNCSLFQRQVTTGFDQARLTLRIDELTENTLERLHADHIRGLRTHIDRMSRVLEAGGDLEGRANTMDAEVIQMEDDLFFNPGQMTEELSERMDDLLLTVPDEVELISANSLNEFAQEQGAEVGTMRMALNKVVDHLVETIQLNPLRERTQKLGRQFDRISVQLKSAADILRDAVVRQEEEENKEVLERAVARSTSELSAASKDLDLAWRTYTAELSADRQQLADSLEVRALIEQAAPLHARIKLAGKRRGVQFMLERAARAVSDRFRSLGAALEGGERRVALARFDRLHKDFRNDHGLVADMMAKLDLDKELDGKVPFHYQYLFSGKHLNITRALMNRERESSEVSKATERIRNGRSGAIMFLGASLSGKSFFVEHVARSISERDALRINAPSTAATTRKALTKAFQKATGNTSSLDRLLSELPTGTTFVFNDLEKWWSLDEGGHEAIEHLARMIERYGSRHFFLLSANLHAFRLMKNIPALPACLVSTIVLTPVSVKELSLELWMRHRAGGMDLVVDGKVVRDPRSAAMRSLVRRIHGVSKGNIGLALRIWLASARKVENDTITIGPVEAIEFPDLENAAWKSMLYQFILYRDISRERLLKLYHVEGQAWVDRQLAGLRKAGILEEAERNVFSLVPVSRPFVEAWLKELQILN